MKNTPTDDLIALTCKSLAEEFASDNIVPGLVIAHLRPEKSPTGQACFYVCARRYDPELKLMPGYSDLSLEKCYHEDLDVAVRTVVKALAQPTEHQRALEIEARRLPEVDE